MGHARPPPDPASQVVQAFEPSEPGPTSLAYPRLPERLCQRLSAGDRREDLRLVVDRSALVGRTFDWVVRRDEEAVDSTPAYPLFARRPISAQCAAETTRSAETTACAGGNGAVHGTFSITGRVHAPAGARRHPGDPELRRVPRRDWGRSARYAPCRSGGPPSRAALQRCEWFSRAPPEAGSRSTSRSPGGVDRR
jgi:hypothetical protein